MKVVERNSLFLDWCEHCQEARAEQSLTNCFDWLASIYSDQSRFYSNLALLERLFEQVHRVERTHPVSSAVKFALWTHCLVVCPTEGRARVRHENAKEAHRFLTWLSLDRKLLDCVLTILFLGRDGEDELFFSDLLFSELAPTSFSEFMEREKNRAREFVDAHWHLGRPISPDYWRAVRRLEFSVMLNKAPFFKTPHLAPLESIVQKHLTRYLESSN